MIKIKQLWWCMPGGDHICPWKGIQFAYSTISSIQESVMSDKPPDKMDEQEEEYLFIDIPWPELEDWNGDEEMDESEQIPELPKQPRSGRC